MELANKQTIRRLVRGFLAMWTILVTVVLVGEGAAQAQEPTRVVPVVEVRGIISPIVAGYVARSIADAERAGAPLLVLTMDTPGGLESSMRDITQAILAARIPVVVFVYPAGARAASAGMYIAYGAHVSAMAPSTNIGSAHPVQIGSDGGPSETGSVMQDKITNDSVAWVRSLAELRGRNAEWAERAVRESVNVQASEALRLNVIDLIADDVPDLLRKLDGRTVKLETREVRLSTGGISTDQHRMTFFERFVHVISDPTVAYLLLSIGGLALVYELGNPGAILPGVVGGIAVLLALYALGTLPVGFAGIALILFALLLFVVDLWLASSGVLTIGAIVSFVLGSILLAVAPGSEAYVRVSSPVAIGTSVGFAAALGLMAALVIRTHLTPVFSGANAMVGKTGVAKTDVGEAGTVLVEGELWLAQAAEGEILIPAGRRIQVVAIEGLHVTVRVE